ncbi:hypothetical protein GCM10010492_54580 [Saccharothrix mutabilis subsp. mutabilis]|uniref:Uncharacterized protein n=1 Tax=Saccharothrix mutabilis subsp. mutabilis TaxID=66855 RepID=A0ABN0UEG2_9PSEU
MVHVVGNAGGTFHLRDGLVIAVDSPGSPGVEALLLGSGRVGAEDWNAALADSVETRSLHAALVGRGVVGATEIQVLTSAVVRDGAFAVATGGIERCVVGDTVDAPLLTAADGVAPESLLADTARRLDAVASLPFPVSPLRDRVVPAGGVDLAGLTPDQREIVVHATGRRTARDIAFVVGRGLYAVTVAISRMLGRQLLEIAPPETSFSPTRWDLTSLRPRTGPGRAAGRGDDRTGPLPTRRPGRSMWDPLRPTGADHSS